MKIGTIDISKIYLGSAEIEKIYLGTEDVYDGGDTPTPPAPSYDTQYLTIESTYDGPNRIYWKTNISNQNKTISASTDNGATWTEYTSTTGGTTIATLNPGDKVLVKGTNATYTQNNPLGYFGSDGQFIVYGNIMSLVYGDNFSGQTTLTSSETFKDLFVNCYRLTSAENLILPATTLTRQCYAYMFANDEFLTAAPALPATTLADYCYQGMFAGCMSLIYAPTLSAATLTEGCYNNMFGGCSSLDTITCLATDISATDCTLDWTYEVASGGGYLYVPSGNPASWECGVNGVPSNWTIEDTNGDTYECTGGDGPSTDVPLNNGFAVKVNGEWYENMFYGISSIDDIESRLGSMGSGDMGIDPSDVEELAIGNMTMNINLDGYRWESCTGLTLAQNVTETDDIHNFSAMQWVNVMASNLEYMGVSGLFSYMNCCPIYVPDNYFSEYQMNWENETTDDCEGTVADRLVAWDSYIDPNS